MKNWIAILFLCLSCSHPLLKTNPDKKLLRICAVGDTGTGNGTQQLVASELKKANCDRLVLLGDIIYTAGIKSAHDPILKKRFYNYYDLNVPIYIVLGNHDYQGNPGAWREIAEERHEIIYPGKYFEEHIGNDICFFYLDTNFAKDTLKFFDEYAWLAKKRSCKYRVGFSHHPYWSNGPHHGPSIGFAKDLLKGQVIGKFDYLFSGHEHVLEDVGNFDGTWQIIAGSGGRVESGFHPGFAVFTLDTENPKESSVELVKL